MNYNYNRDNIFLIIQFLIKKREQACVNILGMANTIAGISYTHSFPQFLLFSTYARALPLLQSAILNMDKMVDTSEALATAS
jgi:hypothetical protein